MPSYTETSTQSVTSSTVDSPSRHNAIKDAAAVLLVAALSSAVAVHIVQANGLADDVTDYTRKILSYIGVAICLVSAPSLLLCGRHISTKTGFIIGTALIFSLAYIASLVG